MSTGSGRQALVGPVFIVLWIALACDPAWSQAVGAASKPVRTWTKVSVELPSSETLFPAGDGDQLANGQCLICHSAGMVLRQPPLTLDQWRTEVNKMRNAYGAPLPANQVDALVGYLHRINGK